MGTLVFCSATESSDDGGLTTFAPVVLGKALRGDDLAKLLPSLAAYFNEGGGSSAMVSARGGLGTARREAGYSGMSDKSFFCPRKANRLRGVEPTCAT